MPTPILATKLYIPPPRPGIVPRPRLVERLNAGLASGRKLTLISAPAGFGKTTLVSEWVATVGKPVVWLSLDEGDGEPARFLTYLIAALRPIEPVFGERLLTALESPQPPQIEMLLTPLVNEIAAIPSSFILVLDDYHDVESNPVHHALTFIVEHHPPQMHLVIASREDPPLPLARLRARGQLTELRTADLRFTPTEAADFLNRMMGLNLSEEDVASLETRTEGWIAGLQMAAISMQGQQDTASFIKSFTGSHRFVLDYLLEEVLDRQTPEVQAFLLCTSILDRLCGPLCDAVLESPSAFGQQTLEHLENTNLFIVPLDNERRWYRYHHLFRDLLNQRLGQPQELSRYHLRASQWHEINGDLDQAFHHAHAAGDVDRAVRLAEAAWQGMERNFRTNAWIGWVKKLPEAVICSRAWLCIQMGWSYSDIGEVEQSELFLQHAERALPSITNDDEFKSIPSNIALIRAGNAQSEGKLEDTVKYAEESIRLADEGDNLLRAQAAITLGFTHWAAGEVEASLQAMHTWMDDMQKLGNLMYVLASAFVVADMQVSLGRMGDAERTLQNTIGQAAAHGQEAEVVTAHHHLGLAMIAHERGDEITSAQHLQTASELGQHTTLIDWPNRWNSAKARLNESAGEWDAALESLKEVKRVYVKNPIPLLQPVAARVARVFLKQGRLDKAQAWARDRGLSVNDEINYLGEYEYLTLARVRLAEQSFQGVVEMLERLLALAEKQKRAGSVIEILSSLALAHQAQGNWSRAFSALQHALTIAEPEGYLRTFTDEGETMRQLLQQYRSALEYQGSQPVLHYVEKILSFCSKPGADPSNSTKTNLGAGSTESLSSRELEILRLISEGYSNAEIGHRLYLALSTIKGHNLRIFNKLQAQNRTEAVARARELGLL